MVRRELALVVDRSCNCSWSTAAPRKSLLAFSRNFHTNILIIFSPQERHWHMVLTNWVQLFSTIWDQLDSDGDRPQYLFYFVPQENLTVKNAMTFHKNILTQPNHLHTYPSINENLAEEESLQPGCNSCLWKPDTTLLVKLPSLQLPQTQLSSCRLHIFQIIEIHCQTPILVRSGEVLVVCSLAIRHSVSNIILDSEIQKCLFWQ